MGFTLSSQKSWLKLRNVSLTFLLPSLVFISRKKGGIKIYLIYYYEPYLYLLCLNSYVFFFTSKNSLMGCYENFHVTG